jgi:hypothetical protein
VLGDLGEVRIQLEQSRFGVIDGQRFIFQSRWLDGGQQPRAPQLHQLAGVTPIGFDSFAQASEESA